MQFYYDQQIRRYLVQFIRMFSNFTVQKGTDNLGNIVYDNVPAHYGDVSRNAGHVLLKNSENTLNSVPFISCHIDSLALLNDLRKYPQYEETIQIIEKKFNQQTNQYEQTVGNEYQVTRYQPVPYKLTMQCDIWTSNTDQKLQLMEQILVLFNPSINLHTTSNALDWTALTYCELSNITWTSRTIPSGADDIIDVATLTFDMPIMLNPPAKMQRQNLIQTILSNLSTPSTANLNNWKISDPAPWKGYNVVTFNDYRVQFINGQALLLDKTGASLGGDGSVLNWNTLLDNYGIVRPGISQIRLRQGGDVTNPANDVVGTITINPNPQILDVAVALDTITANTQGVVDAIVDPTTQGPGIGLPAAATGQRYMILADVPNGGSWGITTALKNDIISFNGTAWVVVFNAAATSTLEYVTNVTSGAQFEWTGTLWQNSYEGTYKPGWWRIYI